MPLGARVLCSGVVGECTTRKEYSTQQQDFVLGTIERRLSNGQAKKLFSSMTYTLTQTGRPYRTAAGTALCSCGLFAFDWLYSLKICAHVCSYRLATLLCAPSTAYPPPTKRLELRYNPTLTQGSATNRQGTDR